MRTCKTFSFARKQACVTSNKMFLQKKRTTLFKSEAQYNFYLKKVTT